MTTINLVAQRVLLASRTPEELQTVREGLETAGIEVHEASELESVLTIARRDQDLVIVAEELNGGSGADVCAVLEGLPGHAPLLYVGPVLVPGADAVAPPGDTERILEQALALLEGSALIQSLGSVQGNAEGGKRPVSPDAPAKPAPKAATPTKSAATPPPPGPSTAPPAPRRDRTWLEALLKKAREADYFEILGIQVDAPDDAVRNAHATLRASLDDVEPGIPRSQLEEVQAALDEALDVLSQPALRAAYTRNRP